MMTNRSYASQEDALESDEPVPGCGGILNSADLVEMIRDKDADGFANLLTIGLNPSQVIAHGFPGTIPKIIMSFEVLFQKESYIEIAEVFIKHDPECFTDHHHCIFKLHNAEGNTKFQQYAELFLANGMDPNIQSTLFNANEKHSLLTYATHLGDREAISTILKYSPDVTYRNKLNKNALDIFISNHYNAEHFDFDTLITLLNAGANPYTKIPGGQTMMEFVQEKLERNFMFPERADEIKSAVGQWELALMARERAEINTKPKRALSRSL